MHSRSLRTTVLGLTAFLALAGAAPATAGDRDLDGIDDAVDNCLWQPNPGQRDTDDDGFGNFCDADLTGDFWVSVADFPPFYDAYLAEPGSHPEADFNGDGAVNTTDFLMLVDAFQSEPGPGALGDGDDTVVCDGLGGCRIPALAGVAIDARESDMVWHPDGSLRVRGDVSIPTPAGDILLPGADLSIDPGVSLVGTAFKPDHAIGLLEGMSTLGGDARVQLSLARGRHLGDAVEVPLQPDAVYVVFESGDIRRERIGDFQVTLPGSGWKLVLDPTDPFLYLGGEVVAIVPSGRGIDLQEVAAGFGVSLSGRIPFRVDAVEAITETFPDLEGDLTTYARGSLGPIPVGFEGFSVIELDPDDDGHPMLGGDASTGRDYRVGLDGQVSLDLGIVPGLSLSLGTISGSLISSHTSATSANPRTEHWISGRLPDVEDLGGLTRDLFQIPDEESAFVVYLSETPGRNFFRMASESEILVDTQRLAQPHGVDFTFAQLTRTQLDVDARAIELVGESDSAFLHPDVLFTERQRSRLTLPWSDAQSYEFRLDARAEIAGVSLRDYGLRLTQDVFQHWGRLETPNFTYTLRGEYGVNGPSLEGTYARALPYDYVSVEAAIDLAGRIAAQEDVIALAERDYQIEVAALLDAERELERRSVALDAARATLASAQRRLSSAQANLDVQLNYSCGTCAWYDAPCWIRVGVCEASRPAIRAAAHAGVESARAGVRFAQIGVTAAQAPIQGLELAVGNAARAATRADARAD
ncbi:MAG: hypothetical protein AAGC67_07360, partial [Myxococcota bacterium]